MNRRFSSTGFILLLAALLLCAPGCGLILEGGAYGLYVLLSAEDEESQASLPVASAGQIMTTDARRTQVEIQYQLSDTEGDNAHILAEYSTDSGASWLAASDGGGVSEGLMNLSAPEGGQTHIFLWASATDLPAVSNWNQAVLFRITPRDADSQTFGTGWTSLPFDININTPPLATGITPSGNFPHSVTLQYILLDDEADAVDLTVEVSLTGTAPWSAASRMGSQGESTTGLSATPSGTVHTFVWDCGTDISTQVNVNGVYLRVTPADSAYPAFTGTPWTSGAMDNINYNSIPTVTASSPSDAPTPLQTLSLNYAIIDEESNPAAVTVEYEVAASGTWLTATEATSGSDGITNLTTAPAPGQPHLFIWDFYVGDSLQSNDTSVRVRITARDQAFATIVSPTWTSNSFLINRTGLAHTSVVSADDLSGIQVDTGVLTYSLVDDLLGSGHPVNVEIKYSTDGGSTWLPPTGSASEATWDSRSEGTTSLSADPDGESHTFVWDSFADLQGQDFPPPPTGNGVILRVISLEYNNLSDTAAFGLLNSRMATVVGSTGTIFDNPESVTLDGAGNVYVCDTKNSKIQVLNAQSTVQVLAGITIQPYSLAVVAGTGTAGFNGDNILGVKALLSFPAGIAVDGASPPNVYVADTLNNRIRRIDGSSGYITTVAGTGTAGLNGDGNQGPLAEMNGPRGIFMNSAGNLWIADTLNAQIRLLNLGTSSVSHFNITVNAGCLNRISGRISGLQDFRGEGRPFEEGGASGPAYDHPSAVAVDGSGNVYVSDTNNHRIRVGNAQATSITLAGTTILSGQLGAICGDGTAAFSGDGALASTAQISSPRELRLDSAGHIYFDDSGNNRVRAIDTGAGTLLVGSVTFAADQINTVAGGGTNTGDGISALSARLNGPLGLVLDNLSPQNLYIADTSSNRIRIVNADPSTTLNGVATDQGATISVSSGYIETVAGIMPVGLQLRDPWGVCRSGTALYLADPDQHRVQKIDLTTRALTVFAGSGTAGYTGDSGTATTADLNAPQDVSVDSAGDLVLICDTQNGAIRAVNTSVSQVIAYGVTIDPGEIETLSTAALLPTGCVADSQGWAGTTDDLYVSDAQNHVVLRIARSDGSSTVVAGTSGTAGFLGDTGSATSARLDTPQGLCIDSSGNIYVADELNQRVRMFAVGGNIDTVAGTGMAGYNGNNLSPTASDLNRPRGVLMDGSGNLIVVDTLNHCLRRSSGGVLTLIVGTASAGFNGDSNPGVNTQLNSPSAGLFDMNGNLYLTDTENRRLRRFNP